MARVQLGVRWDDDSQNPRLRRARDAGLLDYVEANYPIAPQENPEIGGVPTFVHSPTNAVASPAGLNRALCEQIRGAAERFASPWVGEHLCATGPEQIGRLGYIVNPILHPALADVAATNARALAAYYGRPVALELGPHYQRVGDYASEMHFLGDVAERADCLVLLDIAHWSASNRNLRRAADYGLDAIDPARVVELHLAGLRAGRSGEYWHDAHERLPDEELLALVLFLARTLPNVRALTFEHAPDAPEADLVATLERLRKELS